MTKSQESQIQWNLNFTPSDDPTIIAVVDLEFRNIIAQALSEDNFAKKKTQNLPTNWHIEDNAHWFNLNRLYIPETLRIKAK